jgi:hypothetical protein
MTNADNLNKRDINSILVALSSTIVQYNEEGLFTLAYDMMKVYNKLNPSMPYPEHVMKSVREGV